MVDRICVVLEALSVVICLHHLYGKKFRFDIVTVSFLTIEMITMQAIDYFGWPSELSMLFYPIIAVYCVIEFGFDLKKLVINNILNTLISCIFQVSVAVILYIVIDKQIVAGIAPLISNCIILLIVIIVLPKLGINRLSNILKDKEIILIISLITCIGIILFWLINFKKIDFLNRYEWFQNILFFVCVSLIGLLVFSVGKYKLKSKEIETELKMHMLYANSFDNLIDNIRARQHEFDNHINTIYSQHFIYDNYKDLVEAQKNYCQIVASENKFNKLLVSGNRVIISFLYGKFSEIDNLGIEVSYYIDINEMQVNVPIYKLVEILGNLIGNAVDALMTTKIYNRLYVLMIEEEGHFNIEVRNESEFINYSEIALFFTKGYSKKGEDRGLGLYHVKSICDEYKLNMLCQNIEIDGINWISFMISSKKETIE